METVEENGQFNAPEILSQEPSFVELYGPKRAAAIEAAAQPLVGFSAQTAEEVLRQSGTFQLARLELPPLDMASVFNRCEAFFGRQTAQQLYFIYEHLPEDIKAKTRKNDDLERARDRITRAAHLFLRIYPKDPADLPGQGQYGKKWYGLIGGPDELLASVITTALRQSSLSYEAQLNLLESFVLTVPFSEDTRFDQLGLITRAVKGAIGTRQYLIRHRGEKLLHTVDLNVRKAFSRHLELMLDIFDLDEVFEILGPETSIVPLLIDSIVTMEIALSTTDPETLQDKLSEIKVQLDYGLKGIDELNRNQDPLLSAYFEAKAAIWWWVGPICSLSFYFNSLKHILGYYALQMLDQEAYEETQKMKSESLAWANLPPPDLEQNNAMFVVPWALAIVFRNIIEAAKIPGVHVQLQDARAKGHLPTLDKAEKKEFQNEQGEDFETTPAKPMTESDFIIIAKEHKGEFPQTELIKVSKDEIGIAVIITLDEGTRLIDILPALEKLFNALGLIVMDTKPDYVQGRIVTDQKAASAYEAAHLKLVIPKKFKLGTQSVVIDQETEAVTKPLLQIDMRILTSDPYAFFFGGSHVGYEFDRKYGIKAPKFYPLAALLLVAAAYRLWPEQRHQLREMSMGTRITVSLGGFLYTTENLIPTIDPKWHALRGVVVADALYRAFKTNNPDTARMELIASLRAPGQLHARAGAEKVGRDPKFALLEVLHLAKRPKQQAEDEGKALFHEIDILFLTETEQILGEYELTHKYRSSAISLQALALPLLKIAAKQGREIPQTYEELQPLTRDQKIRERISEKLKDPKFYKLIEGELEWQIQKALEQAAKTGTKIYQLTHRHYLDQLFFYARKLPKHICDLTVATARRSVIYDVPLNEKELAYLLQVAARATPEVTVVIEDYIIAQLAATKIDERTLANARNLCPGKQEPFYIPPQEYTDDFAQRLAEQVEDPILRELTGLKTFNFQTYKLLRRMI